MENLFEEELRELWEEGREEGRLEGEKEQSELLAARMFAAGFTDLKQISEIVELPLTEIISIISG